jgi:hypothetical protein
MELATTLKKIASDVIGANFLTVTVIATLSLSCL